MTQLRSSLIFAALMLISAGGLAYADRLGLASNGDERIVGVMIGVLLAWTGNIMPKWGPSDCGACDATRGQSMRRFAGWMFTLAGLAHAAIWVVAPIEMANVIAMGAVGTVFVVVIGRALVTRSWV